ncbi:MAG: hypothetical protein KGJ19_01480 [Betaproteobacteria bacterium]|nr:hypothetical protein [Betaproteobacteria bacterium]MDE2310525.1 hypothetical protein [Betaproteobacteria bacterium]
MTIATARQASSSFRGPQTFGYSADADYVVKRVAQGLAQLRKSNSFGAGIEAATQELRSLAVECSSIGWDGYVAAAIEQETIRQAERFLNALPLGIAAPSVGAEPDGQITFEWYQTPRRILSVSVSPEGDLHYAALLGYRKSYGTEPFFGEIPSDILNLVYRVISG